MKKISLAAILAVMLSAGFSLQTKAQSKTVNIENLGAATVGVNISEMPVYSKAGKLLYTVKRYEAQELPKDVSRMVRNQYYDFDIIGVEEVVIPENTNSIYFIHIGNEAKLKTVRVFNGESEVIKEFKKG